MKPVVLAALLAGVLFGTALTFWAESRQDSPGLRIGAAPVPSSAAVAAASRSAAAVAPPAAPESAARDAQIADALQALNSRLDSLAAEVAQLRSTDGERGAIAPAASSAPRDPVQEAARIAELQAREAELQEARIAEREAELEAEAFDPNWASQAGERFEQLMRDAELPPGLLRDMDCRSERCRVELEYDSEGQVELWMPIILAQFSELAPSGTSRPIEYPDGSRGTVLYLGPDEGGAVTP